MANWKKLAKTALLSDGRIDTKETDIIRKELLADGTIDKSELEFLFELRRDAESSVRVFNKMFFDCVKQHILADGQIDDAEAKWLRKMIFADAVVDEDEKNFLKELKQSAQSVGEEFQKLYNQAVGE